MGRRAREFILLASAWAFSSCFAEVALGVEVSPETTSFHQTATSAQPLSLYHSSPQQGTAVHFNSTGTTPTNQTLDQHHTAAQAGATTTQAAGQTSPMLVSTTAGDNATAATQTSPMLVSTTAADNATAAAQSSPMLVSTTAGDNATAAAQVTTQAMETVTPAVKNTSLDPVSSTMQDTTHVSSEKTASATNTTIKHTTSNTQVTAAALSAAATTMQTVKPTTWLGNQTTPPNHPTATATTNTTTVHPGTQTTIPTTTTSARTTLAPEPSSIPIGTYTVSSGNKTCIRAVMGLQLMARNTHTEQMEYTAVNPNATEMSGSCGTAQSELKLTFSGGFINFTFVKQAPMYYVSKIETSLQLSSEGMIYYAAIHEKLFATKLGNSFKCASKQIFSLEKNFQILFVNMQLQAFDLVGNQFGKEEECFPDRNSKAAPIAVGLSILGLFVIVFVTFLISRRKPHRGYERI